MSDSQSHRGRKVSLVTVIVLVLTTAVSTAVIAGHSFSDVPDSNQFHGSIDWMADNEVTVGCNDAGTEFCPDDNVRRETMASFMRRFAQTFGSTGQQVTDFGSPVTVDQTSGIEVASIDVTPKDEATVTLNAHVQIEVDDDLVRFIADIARGSCDGEIVGSAQARHDSVPDAFHDVVIAVTGFDVIDSDTTYVLCARKFVGAHPDGTVYQRGLTASWVPTA